MDLVPLGCEDDLNFANTMVSKVMGGGAMINSEEFFLSFFLFFFLFVCFCFVCLLACSAS